MSDRDVLSLGQAQGIPALNCRQPQAEDADLVGETEALGELAHLAQGGQVLVEAADGLLDVLPIRGLGCPWWDREGHGQIQKHTQSSRERHASPQRTTCSWVQGAASPTVNPTCPGITLAGSSQRAPGLGAGGWAKSHTAQAAGPRRTPWKSTNNGQTALQVVRHQLTNWPVQGSRPRESNVLTTGLRASTEEGATS